MPALLLDGGEGAAGQVIPTGYIFKPRTEQVDRVARAVGQLRSYEGLEGLTIATFYSYACDMSLELSRADPEQCVEDLREYLNRRD